MLGLHVHPAKGICTCITQMDAAGADQWRSPCGYCECSERQWGSGLPLSFALGRSWLPRWMPPRAACLKVVAAGAAPLLARRRVRTSFTPRPARRHHPAPPRSRSPVAPGALRCLAGRGLRQLQNVTARSLNCCRYGHSLIQVGLSCTISAYLVRLVGVLTVGLLVGMASCGAPGLCESLSLIADAVTLVEASAIMTLPCGTNCPVICGAAGGHVACATSASEGISVRAAWSSSPRVV